MEKKQNKSDFNLGDATAAFIFLCYAICAGFVSLFKDAKDSIKQKMQQRRVVRQR